MGVFTNQLVVEIREKHKYPFRVFRTFEFHSGMKDSGLLIRCEEGFEFDGTSMPPMLRWLISPADPSLLQCAAIHDKGFRTGAMLLSIEGHEKEVPVHRDAINGLMSEAMQARKVRKWKRVLINSGLAIGSYIPWQNHRKKNAQAMRTKTTE